MVSDHGSSVQVLRSDTAGGSGGQGGTGGRGGDGGRQDAAREILVDGEESPWAGPVILEAGAGSRSRERSLAILKRAARVAIGHLEALRARAPTPLARNHFRRLGLCPRYVVAQRHAHRIHSVSDRTSTPGGSRIVLDVANRRMTNATTNRQLLPCGKRSGHHSSRC